MPEPVKNVVVEAAAEKAMEALTKEAGKSTNAMSVTAVADAAPAIERAMEKAIAATPEMQHVLNTEAHFWQKRTFWSALASAATFLGAAGIYIAERMSTGDANELTLGLMFSAALAGYGAIRAGIATRPLGMSPTISSRDPRETSGSPAGRK